MSGAPMFPMHRYEEARRLTKENRFDDALSLLRKLDRDAPNNVELMREKSFCLEQAGRLDEAFAGYQKLQSLVTSRYQHSSNFGNLARVKSKMGHKLEALDLLERAIELNDDNGKVLALHSTIANEMGLSEREIKSRLLYAAIRDAPHASKLANQRGIGECFMALKRYAEAADAYKTIVDNRSDSPKDLREYATALQKCERFTEAAAVWQKVSRFRCDDATVWTALATCLHRGGSDYKAAAAAYEKAHALKPSPVARYNIGLACEEQAKRVTGAAALEALKKAESCFARARDEFDTESDRSDCDRHISQIRVRFVKAETAPKPAPAAAAVDTAVERNDHAREPVAGASSVAPIAAGSSSNAAAATSESVPTSKHDGAARDDASTVATTGGDSKAATATANGIARSAASETASSPLPALERDAAAADAHAVVHAGHKRKDEQQQSAPPSQPPLQSGPGGANANANANVERAPAPARARAPAPAPASASAPVVVDDDAPHAAEEKAGGDVDVDGGRPFKRRKLSLDELPALLEDLIHRLDRAEDEIRDLRSRT